MPPMSTATPPAVGSWPNKTSHEIETPHNDPTRAFMPDMIGESPVMQRLFSIIQRVAPTEASVLLTGATGTGKEVAARTIHELSSRRNGAFVDLNCSAIPETLIEAELFGHQ